MLTEFAAAGVLFVLFIFIELRQERPMLDLSFFRNPTYVGANIAGLSFAACLLTMLTFLPIYFQGGLGVGAQTAGLLMLPMAVPLFIVPRVVVAQLSHRFTGRALLTAGLVILSAGLFAMAVGRPLFPLCGDARRHDAGRRRRRHPERRGREGRHDRHPAGASRNGFRHVGHDPVQRDRGGLRCPRRRARRRGYRRSSAPIPWRRGSRTLRNSSATSRQAT